MTYGDRRERGAFRKFQKGACLELQRGQVSKGSKGTIYNTIGKDEGIIERRDGKRELNKLVL